MAGFQFVHIETYSRKPDTKGRSVEFVLAEASRQPEASVHVRDARPPTTVHGVSIERLRGIHDERSASAVATTKAGKTRKIRSDQHTLLTIVASHPSVSGTNAEAVLKWQERTLDWLKGQWGDDLVTVVRHDDEAHPHLHAYVLPSDGEMRAKRLHPGASNKAKEVAAALASGNDARTANRLGDTAYKTAMRGFQDDFFEHVGLPSGLARLGPGRRRLDRDQWKIEQAQAERVPVAIAAAEQAEAAASAATVDRQRAAEWAERTRARGKEFLAQARQAAEAAKRAADAAEREAAKTVEAARIRAGRIVADAERKAARLRRLGVVLGQGWAAMTGVRGVIERAADRRVAEATQQAERSVEIAEHSRQVVVAEMLKQSRRANAAHAAWSAAEAARAGLVSQLDRVSRPEPSQRGNARRRGA